MKIHQLRCEAWYPLSLEKVFEFFNRPENLQEITPANLNFKIITPGPIRMQQGAVIDYMVTVSGFPHRWTSFIAEYDPPFSFVDLQMKGPYSFWHHRHIFESKDAGTLVRDEVNYAIGFGILGEWIHQCWIKRELQRIFDHRSKVLQERLR